MKKALVVTSISAPNKALRALAAGAAQAGFDFIVVGDMKSPANFNLEGCNFHSVLRQRESSLAYAALCPPNHYARKNIGYLLAILGGAELIVETDDDNIPRPEFWRDREMRAKVAHLCGAGWTNVYRYFSDAAIWPRGLPLHGIHDNLPAFESVAVAEVESPIQQGLAEGNPDVDAIYRLVVRSSQTFRRDRRIALGHGSWCPFNSQNTAWWPPAYALLYLSAGSSFRMTDIWRSFVAQKIAWANGWSVLFHEANVFQERNQHDLMRDFADEVPGYLHNREIGRALEALNLSPGLDAIPDNLRQCYGALVENSWLAPAELPLLEAWLGDLSRIRGESQ
ncbi:MAG: STELLO glycosyltransferase family protein [Verrucomicrobiota bacterium]|nr:STELLO glycosyltransferase family protein [Verrucomicrobiota bacterium]